MERGGRPLSADIQVQDLHAVTPSKLLELGGGAVNELSYQQSHNFRAPVGQVYVAEPGYLLSKAGVGKHAVITALAGVPTPRLPDFVEALKVWGAGVWGWRAPARWLDAPPGTAQSLPLPVAAVAAAMPPQGLRQGQRVPIEYFTFSDRHRRKSSIFTCNWNWYGPPLVWTRDNAAGTWHCRVEMPRSLAAAASPPSGADAAAANAAGGAELPSLPAGSTPASAASIAAAAAVTDGAPAADDVAMEEVVSAEVLDAATGAATAADEEGSADAGSTDAAWRSQLEERLRCGLCLVDCEIPLVALADGVHSRSFSGCGLVVYHGDTLGLVLVDRNTGRGRAGREQGRPGPRVVPGSSINDLGTFGRPSLPPPPPPLSPGSHNRPGRRAAELWRLPRRGAGPRALPAPPAQLFDRLVRPARSVARGAPPPPPLPALPASPGSSGLVSRSQQSQVTLVLVLQARRLIKPLHLAPSPPLRRGEEVELVCLSK